MTTLFVYVKNVDDNVVVIKTKQNKKQLKVTVQNLEGDFNCNLIELLLSI